MPDMVLSRHEMLRASTVTFEEAGDFAHSAAGAAATDIRKKDRSMSALVIAVMPYDAGDQSVAYASHVMMSPESPTAYRTLALSTLPLFGTFPFRERLRIAWSLLWARQPRVQGKIIG